MIWVFRLGALAALFFWAGEVAIMIAYTPALLLFVVLVCCEPWRVVIYRLKQSVNVALKRRLAGRQNA